MKRLAGPQKFIWTRDPAIDGKAPAEVVGKALAKANDEGDLSELPLKDGRQPVVWLLSSLSERAYADLTRTSLHDLQKAMSSQGLGGALLDRGTYGEDRDAARRGIVGATGAVGEDGRPFDFKFDDAPGGAKILTTETMEALYRVFGPRLIGELGRRVIDLSELDPS